MQVSLTRSTASQNSYVLFRNMWVDYCADLSHYCSDITFRDIDFYQFFHDPNLIHYMITDEMARVLGFVSVYNEKPHRQIFVAEFYVKPRYRRMRIGTQAVENLKWIYDGNICLYILKGNEPAVKFWESQFEYGYIDKSDEYGSNDPNCDFRMWFKK